MRGDGCFGLLVLFVVGLAYWSLLGLMSHLTRLLGGQS